MELFDNIYRDRSVFLTGHTGFKGSWLASWLDRLGARVSGYALPPSTRPSHWSLIQTSTRSHEADVRDVASLRTAVSECAPEIVFHLAAQPLVRRSYRDPLENWSTNVMGTANLLEVCRTAPSIKAIVVITTDKVYRNEEWAWGYRETDVLGGHDPYSASKACTELVADSFRKSFFNHADAPLIATVRAGNVIGGGDWSEDRLIPDLVRSQSEQQPLLIRSPSATRPWQHVLETAAGYLQLGAGLLKRREAWATAWNIGPDAADNRTVREVLDGLAGHWPGMKWTSSDEAGVHEANLLYLDSSKARSQLGWRPVWNLDRALAETANWYRAYLEQDRLLTATQIEAYEADAAALGCDWTR